MSSLGVNIDHIATIRQARGTVEPEPVFAASLAEIAGADGITIHLREDRRHIQDRDLKLLRETVRTRLNLEMAPTEEMVSIAAGVLPDMATFVPEKREELTTEGGLDVNRAGKRLKESVARLKDKGVKVSLFVDPDMAQIEAAARVGADYIEIHTGRYAEAFGKGSADSELEAIENAVGIASELKVGINAGHGLDYWNIKDMLKISRIEEYNIGHSIIARAVIVGMEKAVREMAELIRFYSASAPGV